MCDKCTLMSTRDHPLLPQMGVQLVFFSVWRTVSCEMRSTIFNSTNLSAKRDFAQDLVFAGFLQGLSQARFGFFLPGVAL